MSTIAPFVVGLIASGASFAYLSRELVTSRNGLMLKHFDATGADLYYPPVGKGPRRFGRSGNKRSAGGSSLDPDSGSGGLPPPPPSPLPPPATEGEHRLVTGARNKWNAAVLRCSDTIIGALYGSGAAKEKARRNAEARDS